MPDDRPRIAVQRCGIPFNADRGAVPDLYPVSHMAYELISRDVCAVCRMQGDALIAIILDNVPGNQSITVLHVDPGPAAPRDLILHDGCSCAVVQIDASTFRTRPDILINRGITRYLQVDAIIAPGDVVVMDMDIIHIRQEHHGAFHVHDLDIRAVHSYQFACWHAVNNQPRFVLEVVDRVSIHQIRGRDAVTGHLIDI